MYFGATRVISDRAKIAYTKSLLRDAAAKWTTPYTEGSQQGSWTTWNEFVHALKRQFTDVDAENTARTRIESMTQRVKILTDYLNQFRLIAMEANYHDKTMQRLPLRESNRVILDAWAQENRQVVVVDDLAQWVIEKENRINFVKSLDKTPTMSRTDNTPRNPNGIYRLAKNSNQHYGDPMDLDETRRQPRLNISREEFHRRMRERLYLKCGKQGQRAAGCTTTSESFNPQAGPWQQNQKPGPWQTRQQISEIDIESIPEQSGNEQSSPQEID